MGAAATVTIEHDQRTEHFVNNMLHDKAQMDLIFEEMASKTLGHHPEPVISQNALVKYYHESCHPFFLRFVHTERILVCAHKYVCGAKPEKVVGKDFLPKSEFAILIDSIYLFSHLWTLFAGVDNFEDHKLDKKEFMEAKTKIFDGLNAVIHTDTNISDKAWKKQFDKFDANHDGSISFMEFCTYIVDRVVKPEEFATFDDDKTEDEIEAERLAKEIQDAEDKERERVLEEDKLSMYSSGNEAVLDAERVCREYKTKIKIIEKVLDNTSAEELEVLIHQTVHDSVTEKVLDEIKAIEAKDKARHLGSVRDVVVEVQPK